MPHYRRVGEVPPKRHTQFRAPDGSLYAEELMGEDGFSAASSRLYHRHPPTAIVAAETVTADDPQLAPNEPLLPRHLRTARLPGGGDLVTGRSPLLANEDLTIAVAQPTEASGLYRNVGGDELVYVRQGALRLESSFGVLDCGTGDYVVVPTGTTHRWVPLPRGDEPIHVLVVEARGHVGPPRRYLSDEGQFLEHSPYCERDLHAPTEPLVVDGSESPNGSDGHGGTGRRRGTGGSGGAEIGPTGDRSPGFDVLVRQRGGLTRYRYLHHPFDVIGWDGCLYPYRFSIDDFEPITGRIHQPPPVHQTFAGPRFVVCSFVPRKLDYHPLAVPAPYNHANVDCDEVLYYCAGDFTSRKGAGIEAGSISLHPAGFVHGPQPGSVEASLGRERTDELAVMIDTFRPLHLAGAARRCEDPGYPWSWAGGPSDSGAGAPGPAGGT